MCMKALVGKTVLSILVLCGALALSACASQRSSGADIYNHIYKNGWTQTPAPRQGQEMFSEKTASWLL